ncbi:MAG: S8 family serine peptidase [Acidobacteria bacterium]|nr:S8 family serine peptidase [Acidobacteriota bacterium]
MLNTILETTIITETKISPAFAPFLADSGPNDIRDAIVIFRTPKIEEPPSRGRLRALRMKLKEVETRARSQQAIQREVLANYQKAGSRSLPDKGELQVSTIGSNALPVASVEVTPKTLPILAEQPNVVAILPNQRISLIRPKEVDYKELLRQEEKDAVTWGLKQLGIPELWKTTKGKGINVAVLDTGVFAEHPALAGRVADFIVIDPLGRRVKSDPPFDCGTHGTHVCGTIAGGQTAKGVSIGVAPEANLFVAGVLIGDATLRTLMEGISWAVEKGVDIINMSLGFSYFEPLFDEVFKILLDQFGILPVVAIGNENHGNTSSPGNTPNAFSVGAVEKVKGGKYDVAFFSSGASLVFPGDEASALVTKPDVVAPGAQVFSCIPPEKRHDGVFEYSYMNGTSMATPHVAGVAALLMAAKPDAPVTEIIRVLKETAKHPGGDGLRPDNRWGYGMIQPAKALRALG